VWLGWFGPVGIAALFYLAHAHERGVTDERVWAAGTLVVAMSTLVHGLTAPIGRRAYVPAGTDRPAASDTPQGNGRR
jgi:NhaP-type Na+/H+ or K+/H+ antiporter